MPPGPALAAVIEVSVRAICGVWIYVAAWALGLGFVLVLFGLPALLPDAPLHAAFVGDPAISVIGQRYFLAEPWGWPLLHVARLAEPHGTNIALTDSIPLAALLAKLVRGWLPPGFYVSATWVAAVWSLQPVAAVYALRGAGERRLWPAVAVAVLSLTMPTLLIRYGHMALCAHAAMLLALGLYVRLVAGPRRWTWAGASLLLMACLLVHPYILAFSTAVLGAVPLTLLLRRDRRAWVAGLWFGGTLAALGVAAGLLQFGGTQVAEGFGFYSMNLLGPFLPDRFSMFPRLAIDATGGQMLEGHQYFGVGMLVLLSVALVPALFGRYRLGWWRHAGLVLVLGGMAVFALSNRVFAGHHLLLDLGPAPDLLQQFRATGRFFWPATYACLIAGVVVVARAFTHRIATMVLAAAMVLQVADAAPLLRHVSLSNGGGIWAVDEPRLAPIFAAHDRLTLWPPFGCGASTTDPYSLQVLLIASQTTMRTNTIFSARNRRDADCDVVAALAPPIQAGELRVLTRPGSAWQVPDAAQQCRRTPGLVLCSANTASLSELPHFDSPLLAVGQPFFVRDPVLLDALVRGWSDPGADGVWSDRATALLQFRRPRAGPAVLTITGYGFAPVPGGVQRVDVLADGVAVATWDVADLVPGTYRANLPPGSSGVVRIELRIAQPARPIDRGMNADIRTLGFLIGNLRLD